MVVDKIRQFLKEMDSAGIAAYAPENALAAKTFSSESDEEKDKENDPS